MKRLLMLALFALLLAGRAAQAGPVGVSVGVFGGLSIPVLQDVTTSSFSPGDAFGATGSTFGLRVPVHAISSITFDPLPAASIITPMMLFALTLRPLREICTSL